MYVLFSKQMINENTICKTKYGDFIFTYISSVVVWQRVCDKCFASKSSLDWSNLLAPSTTFEVCNKLLLLTVDGMGAGRGNSGNTIKENNHK